LAETVLLFLIVVAMVYVKTETKFGQIEFNYCIDIIPKADI
jgi:hypothetical protein